MFATVPTWGQDGSLTGYVYGAPSSNLSLYIFEFIPDIGWYGIPSCGPVSIDSTGRFTANATGGILGRYATRFTAYLVPSSLTVPCVQATPSIPFLIQNNAVAAATIPRLAQYSTISFGGLTWFIKSAPVPVYAGPQFFINQNAFVDNLGQLHLRVSQCSGSWCAAEIFTTQTVGYGTYTFNIASQINNLDPNVTLGLFTWDAQASDQNNRELDIEFGRWGNANASANAQYVVQPYNGPNNIYKFLMSPTTPSTHTITWSPNGAQFASSGNTGQISSWTYPGGPIPVPTPGDVHLHMNFYIASGQAPTVPVNQEIVISNFSYTPSGPQIGFSRTSDSDSFLAGSYSVPVSSSGSCGATVESDSPWLTVLSPATLYAGGSLEYSVPDNIGAARVGNLIMTSTNCNVALGSQILSVTQPGLVCSPTFDVGSTSIGFLQTVRSVLIRGTASECTWSVTSAAPWLQIISAASGSGDGTIQFSATENTGPNVRVGALTLNNGQQHLVNQDGSGTIFGLSPLAAPSCGNQPPKFAVSWIAPGNVELHIGSATGQIVGQFGPSGSALLPQIGDGTLVYLNPAGSTQPFGSARASILPSNCSAPAILAQGIQNAASFNPIAISPGSYATIRGVNLSAGTAQAAGLAYPTSLGGVSVTLSGEACPLVYVSPTQINFVVPSDLPVGRYLLSVGSATSDAVVNGTSPGIFTLNSNGTGVPLASLVAVTSSGAQVNIAPYQCSANGCVAYPMALPNNLTALYIVLYGTGIRNAQFISAALGSLSPQVSFFGANAQYPGLDQVNLLISNPMGLSGDQQLTLQTDGLLSNAVDLLFQ